MSFVTTPASIENAFRIQMSGDPILAELYGVRLPSEPAKTTVPEQSEPAGEQVACATPAEAN